MFKSYLKSIGELRTSIDRVVASSGLASILPAAAPAASSLSSGKFPVTGIHEHHLRGKNVLVRVDFNVPQDKKTGAITDDTRIRSSVATIQYLQKRGARVILATHLGRPDGKPSAKYSVAPAGKRLSEIMGVPVLQLPDVIGAQVKTGVQGMKDGDIALLENVRFYAGEEKNDASFAQAIVDATSASHYVNDAFGTAHRAHASTAGVVKYIRGFAAAGFLMEKEVAYLKRAVTSPARPLSAVVGGAKVSTKVPVIESLLNKADGVYLGGAMIFTFLKARGHSVGASLVEDKCLALAKSLEEKAKTKKVELYIPSDVVVAKSLTATNDSKVVSTNAIPDGWMGVDIGPQSRAYIAAQLGKKSKTVIWNGPMGVFETKPFDAGTRAVADAMATATSHGVITIVGGGDSVSAVNEFGLADKMCHVSTGGGASLELLEGRELPGVEVLNDLEATLKWLYSKPTKSTK